MPFHYIMRCECACTCGDVICCDVIAKRCSLAASPSLACRYPVHCGYCAGQEPN
jgi:hypothetical protein